MHIDKDILITYGGIFKKLQKGGFIFWEGEMPYFYYQVIEGEVEIFSTNEGSKELIQGRFFPGDSFGEPPLLIDKVYPSSAIATKDTLIIRLRKEYFLKILKDFPELEKQLLYTLAERIYHKATSVQIWLAQSPEQKIMRILSIIKEKEMTDKKGPVPYTRQQIAHLTGLRTETVIRTLRRMYSEGKVMIKNRKLYYN